MKSISAFLIFFTSALGTFLMVFVSYNIGVGVGRGDMLPKPELRLDEKRVKERRDYFLDEKPFKESSDYLLDENSPYSLSRNPNASQMIFAQVPKTGTTTLAYLFRNCSTINHWKSFTNPGFRHMRTRKSEVI